MKSPFRLPNASQQLLLHDVRLQLLAPDDAPRFNQLLAQHHYLGAPQPVGERLAYVAVAPDGQWLALLLFCAAAKHLRARDQWIGWSPAQRRRRLALVASNTRFLILPDTDCPNLASRLLALCRARLSDDWQARYAHPLLLVETFVDPQRFSGACYRANGWIELGQTQGYGRCHRDYYECHNQPKRLFVCSLRPNARRTLQAEHLPPSLAAVEQSVPPRCELGAGPLRSLAEHFQEVPDYRARIGRYTLWGLLALVAAAHLCGAPRGYRDLAAFAARLTQAQRRALGFRPDKRGRIPAPRKDTFMRLLHAVAFAAVERALCQWQAQQRGAPSPEQLVVLDGKTLRHSRAHHIVSAVTVPAQHYLGSECVEAKTNEIPTARALCQRLDLEGRLVALDALHTNPDTARQLLQDAGADYLLVVKANQPSLRQTLQTLLPDTAATFSPSAAGAAATRPNPGTQQEPRRNAHADQPARHP